MKLNRIKLIMDLNEEFFEYRTNWCPEPCTIYLYKTNDNKTLLLLEMDGLLEAAEVREDNTLIEKNQYWFVVDGQYVHAV